MNSSKAGFSLGRLPHGLAGIRQIIFTAHGWPHNDTNLPQFVRKLARVFSFLTVLLAHRTIAVSEAVYRDAPGNKLLQNKITVIKNGILASPYILREDARKIIAGEKTVNMPDMWVGTIAELHPNKGIALRD